MRRINFHNCVFTTDYLKNISTGRNLNLKRKHLMLFWRVKIFPSKMMSCRHSFIYQFKWFFFFQKRSTFYLDALYYTNMVNFSHQSYCQKMNLFQIRLLTASMRWWLASNILSYLIYLIHLIHYKSINLKQYTMVNSTLIISIHF